MVEEVALITMKEIRGAEDIGGNVGLNLKVTTGVYLYSCAKYKSLIHGGDSYINRPGIN